MKSNYIIQCCYIIKADGEQKDKDKEKENKKDKERDKEKEKHKEEKERKKLPDLEKYWRVVKDDATDFTGWTYLLQYVDSEVRSIAIKIYTGHKCNCF